MRVTDEVVSDPFQKSFEHYLVPIGVEAEAVDGSRILRQAEVAWLRIAGLVGEGEKKMSRFSMNDIPDASQNIASAHLWLWSDAADFYEAEAEIIEAINGFCLLVKSSSKTDWIDKRQTK